MSTTFVPAAPADGLDGSSRATLALRSSPIPAIRHLNVEESPNEITIRGEVRSYYLKQLAQETLMPVLNHRELHNYVLVVRG
jgi:hypothetical protein